MQKCKLYAQKNANFMQKCKLYAQKMQTLCKNANFMHKKCKFYAKMQTLCTKNVNFMHKKCKLYAKKFAFVQEKFACLHKICIFALFVRARVLLPPYLLLHDNSYATLRQVRNPGGAFDIPTDGCGMKPSHRDV